MGLEGVRAVKVTLINVLNACESSKDLEQGRFVYSLIIEAGLETDVVVGTAAISMFGKCESVQDVEYQFQRMRDNRSVVTWTAMISACSRCGKLKRAVKAFREMLAEGMEPNQVTLISILDSISVPSAADIGRDIHRCLQGSCLLQEGVKLSNVLISMYGKCGFVREAEKIFNQMTSQDSVTWTSMISTYAHNERGKEALIVFRRMDLEGFQPLAYTYASLFAACAQIGDSRIGRLLHRSIMDCGLHWDPVLGNALMSMYGRLGCLEDAASVFEKLKFRNVVSWTTMIDLYARSSLWATKAIETFAFMDLEGSKANEVTYVSVVDAVAEMNSLVTGRLVHSEIVSSGMRVGVVLGNSLMNMFSKCGSLILARNVFSGMVEKDTVSFNTMMAAASHLGYGGDALELFHEMNLRGIAPTELTFSSVLSACSHTGLIQVSFRYFFTLVSDFGSLPAADHYSSMVEVLARGGLLEDAEELIRCMPFEPDVKVWMKLLSVSGMQGDLKRARAYAQRFLELKPDETSSYVLLSNTIRLESEE